MAIDLNNPADLYRTQGKFFEAEPFTKRVIGFFLKRLGPDHPKVATVFGNYQDILKASGQAYDKETVIRKLKQPLKVQSSSTSSP